MRPGRVSGPTKGWDFAGKVPARASQRQVDASLTGRMEADTAPRTYHRPRARSMRPTRMTSR